MVVGSFFKERLLWQKSFVSNGCVEERVVGRFGCCPNFVGKVLFEKKLVGAVERDAVAVSRKLPFGMWRNLFFKGVEEFFYTESTIFEKVCRYRKFDVLVKRRKGYVLDRGVRRNRDRVVIGVVVERDEQCWRK